MSKAQTINLLPALTRHVHQRMAQRNLSCKDIGYMIGHGRTFHCSGAVLVHLCSKDIAAEDRADAAITRLEGATVVFDDSESVILTVWRNRNRGSRHISRKRSS